MHYTEWEDHCEAVVRDVSRDIETKYEAGQKAHGGQLWRKALLPHMTEEVVDLVVYLYTHAEQMKEMLHVVNAGIVMLKNRPVANALALQVFQVLRNILLTGNGSGVEEVEHEAPVLNLKGVGPPPPMSSTPFERPLSSEEIAEASRCTELGVEYG